MATPSSSSSSMSSAPAQTSQPSTDNNANSSLPFSFLITFIAIFLFFLGCGLGSRRFVHTLRRNLGLQVAGVGPARAAPIPRERPLLWDVFPRDVKGRDGPFAACRWANLIVSPCEFTASSDPHSVPPSLSARHTSVLLPNLPLPRTRLHNEDTLTPTPTRLLRYSAGPLEGWEGWATPLRARECAPSHAFLLLPHPSRPRCLHAPARPRDRHSRSLKCAGVDFGFRPGLRACFSRIPCEDMRTQVRLREVGRVGRWWQRGRSCLYRACRCLCWFRCHLPNGHGRGGLA